MNDQFLNEERPLPQNGRGNVVQWHVYRRIGEARAHLTHIMLGQGQHIVGGHSHDSIGDLWWVGVEVDNIGHWGNRSAINKHSS